MGLPSPERPPELRREVRGEAGLVEAIQSASRAAGSGVYLGEGDRGWAWAEKQRPTLVLGPTRSGKTSCVIVPNVLSAAGPVVATSTKLDVMEATAGARSTHGWPLLFDPTGTYRPNRHVTRIGWSPVNACRNWDGALSTAEALVRTGGSATDSGDHWRERAGSLLAPLLHAAALDDRPMATVLSWVDRHEGEKALARLVDAFPSGHPAVDVLGGILSTDSREQSGIWSTASGSLAAYRYTSALASTEGPYLDADAFCRGHDTLYVCAPGRLQQLVAPLVVGLLSEIRDAAYARARQGSTDPPVLLALDEVANMAPLPDLPSIVTEGAGQGLLTLACLQDLSQARARWGQQAEAFLSIFGTSVVLPGIGDIATLEALSALGGEHELQTRSVGTSRGLDGRFQRSLNVGTTFRRRLPPDLVGRGLPGSALCLDATNRVGWVHLTPAHSSDPWCKALGPSAERDRRLEALPIERFRG